ncbi:MAG TPA: type II toxin-antitoxin system HigB family toxin [Thermomicrobiales bacterium]|nr:type II toxin-antitoxin system HigB family toxin [Thermomicrobiales bacterium]
MHVISKKKLREFYGRHTDAEEPLLAWYRIASKARWTNLVNVRQTYPSADLVGDKTVFNIKGNHYRLIVYIKYESQTIFIRHVLTHAEYNRGDWKP